VAEINGSVTRRDILGEQSQFDVIADDELVLEAARRPLARAARDSAALA
jgi:hypothetical protein